MKDYRPSPLCCRREIRDLTWQTRAKKGARVIFTPLYRNLWGNFSETFHRSPSDAREVSAEGEPGTRSSHCFVKLDVSISNEGLHRAPLMSFWTFSRMLTCLIFMKSTERWRFPRYRVAFFNKAHLKIIWLSWNCVSTMPQVRTRTLSTSVSVGTYSGAMIRFMFSKKLERSKFENL